MEVLKMKIYVVTVHWQAEPTAYVIGAALSHPEAMAMAVKARDEQNVMSTPDNEQPPALAPFNWRHEFETDFDVWVSTSSYDEDRFTIWKRDMTP